jgi:ATP-dependent DNA helicase DinG
MTMKISMSDWKSEQNTVLSAYFADGGLLSKAVGNRYRHSQVQCDYANALQAHLLHSTSSPAIAVMLEAATGVGKTHGYLGPSIIHALLQGKRVHISTYTNELKRQVGDDARIAAAALEPIVGRRARVAMRYANHEFASPDRAINLAERLEHENGGETPASLTLKALADWTADEIKFTKTNPIQAVAEGRGLVSTWRGLNPVLSLDLPNDAYDLWCIDPIGGDDLTLRNAYDAAMENADVVICSHATTIIDANLGGRLLGGVEKPFGVSIIDEADRMADAARSVLSQKTSLRSLERSILTVQAGLESDGYGLSETQMAEMSEAIAHYQRVFGKITELADRLSTENRARSTRYDHMPVLGDEDWLIYVNQAGDAACELGELLYDANINRLRPVSDTLIRRGEGALKFVEAARDPKKSQGRTFISFSPVNSEPSLLIDARYAGRMLNRLWNGTRRIDNTPLSESVVLTSATLTQPGARGPQRWKQLMFDIGLDMGGGAKFNAVGSGSFAPDVFGEVRFVLTDPASPIPARRDEDGIDPSNAHRVAMISAAAARPGRDGRRNVLVLTTSFRDTEALNQASAAAGLEDRLILRDRNMSLRRALHLFSTTKDAILITPGAWEGVNLPGLIDHLVIAKLPYAPPEDDFGNAIWGFDEENGRRVSRDINNAMRKLKQGIGRAIRAADDDATIWIADPRFCLPAAVEEREMTVSPYQRNRVMHECVPTRFRAALDAAEIFPYVPPVTRTRRGRRSA